MAINYQMKDINDAIEQSLGKYADTSFKCNILVTGKAGVGKSTLVNSIFHENLSPTAVGRPVHINDAGYAFYEKEGIPVRIYDTEGIELSKTQQDHLLSQLCSLVRNPNSSKLEDRIHIIWYCIISDSSRIEREEEDFINRLSQACEPEIPVIIVLTQSVRKKAAKIFQETLEENFGSNHRIKAVLPVLAETVEEDEYIIESFGLDILSKQTAELIPDSVKNSFIASQKVDLEQKIEEANHVVNRYVAITSATGGGAGLIGVDDSLALMGTQIAMFVEIGYLFGLKLNKNKLLTICSASIGTTVASFAGKTAFSQALRFIPVAGQVIAVAEGCVRAGIAGIVTKSVGSAYVSIMKRLSKGEISEDMIESQITNLLKNSKK